jgi:hypothetical protein
VHAVFFASFCVLSSSITPANLCCDCALFFSALRRSRPRAALCQIITLAFILKSRNQTGIFPPGTKVGSAFVLSQISWATDIVLASALLIAGILAARRGDGYSSIPSTPRSSRRWAELEEEEDD